MELRLKEARGKSSRGESFFVPSLFWNAMNSYISEAGRIVHGKNIWSNHWLKDLDLPTSVYDLLDPIEFDFEDFLRGVFELNLEKKHNFKVERAVVYSAFLHKDQMRTRERLPYLVHILRVSNKVAEFLKIISSHGFRVSSKLKSDLIVSSLLHDSVEDHALGIVRHQTGVPRVHISDTCARGLALDIVEQHFGPNVRLWVSTLSKPLWEDTGAKGKSDNYRTWVRHIWQDGDFENTIIKLADIFDNLDSTLKDLKNIAERKIKDGRLSREDIAAKKKNNELVLKYLGILISLKRRYDEWVNGSVLQDPKVKGFILSAIDKRVQEANEYFDLYGKKDVDLLKHLEKFTQACVA